MSSKLTEIQTMIESAEAALKNAKRALLSLTGDDMDRASVSSVRSMGDLPPSTDGGKVIEGIFNGERMVAPDGETYPVPANYASKSKLISSDHLKLTILADGRFVYKQIGPVPRKTVIGTLVYEGGQYKVLVGSNSFKVLLASVTYYKAHVGDKITLIVSDTEDSEWGAIEAVLPKDVSEFSVTDDQPEEEVEVDF